MNTVRDDFEITQLLGPVSMVHLWFTTDKFLFLKTDIK